MDTKEQVYDYVLEHLKGFSEISRMKNVCNYNPDDFLADSLKGTVLDSCFYLKSDSSELAAAIYRTLMKAGFSPDGYLRQDYLKWTGSLFTQDRAFSLGLGVESLDDAKAGDGERWQLRQQGYHSKVYLNIYDERKKKQK